MGTDYIKLADEQADEIERLRAENEVRVTQLDQYAAEIERLRNSRDQYAHEIERLREHIAGWDGRCLNAMAEERERCAKIAESFAGVTGASRRIAAAIRGHK